MPSKGRLLPGSVLARSVLVDTRKNRPEQKLTPSEGTGIHGTLNVLEPASPQLSIARSKLLILCPMVSIVWRTKFLCPEGRIGGLPALEGADTSLTTAGHAHLRLRLTPHLRLQGPQTHLRLQGPLQRDGLGGVGGWGGNLNASGGHCGEGCRVGGQHERSHLPRGNALGQRGGEQQRRKQWRQRNIHFESRVTCWRCAKDSTAWLASLWRFFPPLCASS